MSDLLSRDDGEKAANAHAYCNDCTWYATPDDHSRGTVAADAEWHTTAERGHTVTVGSSEEIVEEAQQRATMVRSTNGEENHE